MFPRTIIQYIAGNSQLLLFKQRIQLGQQKRTIGKSYSSNSFLSVLFVRSCRLFRFRSSCLLSCSCLLLSSALFLFTNCGNWFKRSCCLLSCSCCLFCSSCSFCSRSCCLLCRKSGKWFKRLSFCPVCVCETL